MPLVFSAKYCIYWAAIFTWFEVSVSAGSRMKPLPGAEETSSREKGLCQHNSSAWITLTASSNELRFMDQQRQCSWSSLNLVINQDQNGRYLCCYNSKRERSVTPSDAPCDAWESKSALLSPRPAGLVGVNAALRLSFTTPVTSSPLPSRESRYERGCLLRRPDAPSKRPTVSLGWAPTDSQYLILGTFSATRLMRAESFVADQKMHKASTQISLMSSVTSE